MDARFDVDAHRRSEDEDPPESVDDRGHCGEQLDDERQRDPQPGRRELGQEDRDAKAHGHAEEEGERRGHEHPVDEGGRSKALRDGIPDAAAQETEAVGADGLRRRQIQDDRDEDEESDDGQGGECREALKDKVPRGRP